MSRTSCQKYPVLLKQDFKLSRLLIKNIPFFQAVIYIRLSVYESCQTGVTNFSFCPFVRWGDEVLLLQVLLQSGHQSGLQSSGRQSPLLLQRWLQCDELRLPPARTQLPAAVSASVVPLFIQVVVLLNFIMPTRIHPQHKCQKSPCLMLHYTMDYLNILLWFTLCI